MKAPVGLLLISLASCQAGPPTYRAPNGKAANLSLEVQAPFDEAWQAIIETFAGSTTAIETIEKASGFVAAARPVDFAGVKDLATLVDFGAVDNIWSTSYVNERPERASARVRYNVFVSSKGSSQTVKVNTSWTGKIAIHAIGRPVPFEVVMQGNSTGRFERLLLEAIAAKLTQGNAHIVELQQFARSTFDPAPRSRVNEPLDDW